MSMVTKLKIWWRDWRRGYTDQDNYSMIEKFKKKPKPGGVIKLSSAEHKAFMDFQKALRSNWKPII